MPNRYIFGYIVIAIIFLSIFINQSIAGNACVGYWQFDEELAVKDLTEALHA